MSIKNQINPMLNEPEPKIQWRIAHIDFKGVPPTFDRLLEHLRIIRYAGYNAVLLEWEDMFPWEVDQRFRNASHYSREQIQKISDEAKALELEIIPLVQTLGHMESFLRFDNYAHMLEEPNNIASINPLADGAAELISGMVRDMMDLFPDVKYLHLGGDESWCFAQSEAGQAYLKEHSKAALFCHHYQPLLDIVNERGIRPMLWHDMMIEWDIQELSHFLKQVDIMVWGYQGQPGGDSGPYSREVIDRFAQAGANLWGAAAYKGGDGSMVNLPHLDKRVENAEGWAKLCEEVKALKGVCATGWSRYSTELWQIAPFDITLNVFFLIGAALHDGRIHDAHAEQLTLALDRIGEAKNWQTRVNLVQKLTARVDEAWRHIKGTHMYVACRQHDNTRAMGAIGWRNLGYIKENHGQAKLHAEALQASLAGSICSPWLENWLATQINAIHPAYHHAHDTIHAWAEHVGTEPYQPAETYEIPDIY